MNRLNVLKDRRVKHGLLALFLLVTPLIIKNSSVQHVAILIGLYCMLSLGLEIALGLTGLFSLCHAAFYGMGAYVSALLSIKFDLSFWITLPIAAVCSSLLGVLIGLPALRTKGDYLAIATLGCGEIFRLVLVNGGEFTRGPRGLTGIARPKLFNLNFTNKITYLYLIIVFAYLVYIFVLRIPRTFLGRALMAIRDDEDAAEFMGINTAFYKVLAFALSGLIAGIAGAFYAHYICYISPDTFVYNDSITILTMVLLGGGGTVIGPVIGAIALTILPELLRSFVEYRMLIYGIIVVIMMQIKPQGILGHINLRKGYITSTLKDNPITSTSYLKERGEKE